MADGQGDEVDHGDRIRPLQVAKRMRIASTSTKGERWKVFWFSRRPLRPRLSGSRLPAVEHHARTFFFAARALEDHDGARTVRSMRNGIEAG